MKVSRRGFRGFRTYLEHLMGDWRLDYQHRSEAMEWLRQHLDDDAIGRLTPGQWDRLERTVSAVLGALRVSVLIRQGFAYRPWHPTSAKQPGVRKLATGHGRYYDWALHYPGSTLRVSISKREAP